MSLRSDQPSVIIIGAGSAGLATASKLLSNNFTNFLILEAQDRIGGRVYSTKFGDGIVDMGAQFCHGEGKNIVYALVKDLNILKPTPKFNKLSLVHSELKEHLEISQEYREKVEEAYGKDPNLKKLALDAGDYFLHDVASMKGCFSVYETSARNDYTPCEGDLMLNWDGRGYRTALEVLLGKYPNPEQRTPIDEKILLNKEVNRIVWDDGVVPKVTVKCSDGTTYSADQAVVTIPVGVLKDKGDSLFTPELPPYKRKALQDIGYDAIGKIFVWYPNKWWDEGFEGVGFVWSEKERQKLKNEGNSWILDIFYVVTVEKNPNVLCFWLSGENVPIIESKTDDDIVSSLKFILEHFIGNRYKITKPEKILRTNWYTHRYFKGSYSYDSLKSRQHDISVHEELAKPVPSSKTQKPVLLFAGEATHSYYFSTVHGAMETGFREAQRILDSK